MKSVAETRLQDRLQPEGFVEIFVYRGNKLVEVIEEKNIIFWQGRAELIKTISTTSPALYQRVINRMVIGDLGTIPADSQVPKVPTPDLIGLYHEIYRKDIASKNITTTLGNNYCQFVTTFNASSVPTSAFSNPTTPRVNEVGLVFIDPQVAVVRPDVAFPNTVPADEVVASIRCFKSIPFEVVNDVSVTIRYTLYMV
jgi:hypothetical protein